jgi:hypothetical protein
MAIIDASVAKEEMLFYTFNVFVDVCRGCADSFKACFRRKFATEAGFTSIQRSTLISLELYSCFLLANRHQGKL